MYGATPCHKNSSLTAWRVTGDDRQSIVADPMCFNSSVFVRLSVATAQWHNPALKFGFIPFDARAAGPKGRVVRIGWQQVFLGCAPRAKFGRGFSFQGMPERGCGAQRRGLGCGDVLVYHCVKHHL